MDFWSYVILNSLNGSIIIALRISKTALTATPIKRNGNNSNQTNGYKISTNNANGREIIAKITHNIKVNIVFPSYYSVLK